MDTQEWMKNIIILGERYPGHTCSPDSLQLTQFLLGKDIGPSSGIYPNIPHVQKVGVSVTGRQRAFVETIGPDGQPRNGEGPTVYQ